MSNVIEHFPDDLRVVVIEILSDRDPQLLEALRAQQRPTAEQQETLEKLLLDAFLHELWPDDEPSEHGKLADRALSELFALWPVERTPPDAHTPDET